MNKYKGMQSMVTQAIETKTERELIDICEEQQKELQSETTPEHKKAKIRKNEKKKKKIKE